MPNVLSTADTTVGAGTFNRRITIQQRATSASDGQGGKSNKDWTTLFSTWAHIEPWKGQEVFQGQQVWGNKWITILIRYRPSQNISASMRVLYGSQVYNIRSVKVPAEAQTTIELLCEELQAKGSLR